MNTLTKPVTQIEIEIQNHKFKVSYPLSGEVIDIATLKSRLSDNQYNELMYQNSTESGFALKLINCYCFFKVMVPDLIAKLNISSLLHLTALDSLELIEVDRTHKQ
jgi:hypothetical protein